MCVVGEGIQVCLGQTCALPHLIGILVLVILFLDLSFAAQIWPVKDAWLDCIF